MKMYAKLSRNLFDKNNYKTNVNSYGNTVALFDISKLVIGKKYTFSSEFPFTWFKISNNATGYSSAQKTDSNGFTEFTFTMSRNENIPGSATQYLILRSKKQSSQEAISGSEDLEGYNVMLNEGNTALPYEPYMENPIQPIKFLYKSRQLFDRSLPKFSGWAYIDNFTDNTITVIEKGNVPSTTSWRSINIPIYGLEEGDTITISGEWVNSSNNKGAVMVRWFEPSSLGVGKISAELQTSGGVATGVVTAKPTETAQLCVALYINTNGTLAQYDTVTYKNVMVCKGDKALPYEPYMPLTKMKAFYKSRNLLPKDLKLPATVNGVTYTDNKDGSFTVNGTATSNAPILLGREIPIKAGTYTFKNHNAKIGTDCWIDISGGKHYSLYPRQDSLTFTIEEDGLFRFGYNTYNNTIQDNYIVRLMLNEGSTALPYEPPQEYPN